MTARDLARRLARTISRKPSRRVQRITVVFAVAVLVVAGYASFRALPIGLGELRWWPLAIAGLIGVPMTACANAMEYILAGRVIGERIRFTEALRVSFISTAANMLPLPGAALVRVHGLLQRGSTYRAAVSSVAFIGVAWIGVAAGLAMVGLLLARSYIAGAVFGAGAAVFLAVGWRILRRSIPETRRRVGLGAATILLEVLAVASGAFRIVFVLIGMRVHAQAGDAFVLGVSGALSSAVGVFPAGLGLREVLSAAFAPLVGLSLSVGFASAVINRLLSIAVHAPLTLSLLFQSSEVTTAVVDQVVDAGAPTGPSTGDAGS